MYKSTIEDSLFGGHVLDYSKDPFSSALNNSDFQKVKENLEDGVSLITFLGHSGVTLGFSQNIDIPENWMNENNSNHEFLEELAQIIIRREAYKVFLRTQFSR